MQETISKQNEKKKKEKTKEKILEDTYLKKGSEKASKSENSTGFTDKNVADELLKQPSIKEHELIPSTENKSINTKMDVEGQNDGKIVTSGKDIPEVKVGNEEKEEIIATTQELYERRQKLHDLSLSVLDYTDYDFSINNSLDNILPKIKEKERRKLLPIYFKVSPHPLVRIKELLDKQYSEKIVRELLEKSMHLRKMTDFETNMDKLDDEPKEPVEYKYIGGEDGGFGEENLFKELFEWDYDPKAWDRFQSALNSKEPLCVFLIAKGDKIIGETTIVKLLSTEYNRKYGKIDASHELEDLSDSDKSIITFTPDQVDNFIKILNRSESNIHHTIEKLHEDEHNEFVKQLDNLMEQIDFVRGTEKKLVIFKCNSKSDTTGLYNEVKKRITRTHILKLKHGSLSEDFLLKIIEQLCWLLSIPSHNQQFVLHDDLDSIFTGLDTERQHYYDKLTNDRDWFKIKKSWGEESTEHLNLKLLPYKRLKKLGFNDNEIEIEERFDNEGQERLIPDLHVGGNIWIEIETLLGSAGPSYLIQEKFRNKRNEIKQHKEFWLVLPNFEIFMHKKAVNSLLRQLYDLFDEQVKVTIFGCDFKKKDLVVYRSKGDRI